MSLESCIFLLLSTLTPLNQLQRWHGTDLGHFTQEHTPAGRGFDDFFGFLFGSETHDSHNSWGRHTCNVPIIDLYNSTQRANESVHYLNMTYSPEMYAQEMKRCVHSCEKLHLAGVLHS
eukprot:COSAG03_NODE_89_length_13462_cov_21.049764_4_plen_119_part_00